MTDRRVLIIRRWLLLVGFLLLGLYDPVFWFGALAIIPCPECCPELRCSNMCNDVTESTAVSITIAGVANGSLCTACASVDGTYFTNFYTQNAGPTICTWVDQLEPSPCFTEVEGHTYSPGAQTRLNSGNAELRGLQSMTSEGTTKSQNARWGEWTVLGAAPLSCGGLGPIELEFTLQNGDDVCDYSSSTFTVEF